MDLLDVMKNLTIRPSDDSEQKLFRSVAVHINNVPTEIIYAEFTDKILLIVSQYDKIGTMLTIERDEIHSPLGAESIYTTKVIFGASGEDQEVAARYLAEAINITQPLCLFMNLQSYDIATVKACRDIILDLKKEETN